MTVSFMFVLYSPKRGKKKFFYYSQRLQNTIPKILLLKFDFIRDNCFEVFNYIKNKHLSTSLKTIFTELSLNQVFYKIFSLIKDLRQTVIKAKYSFLSVNVKS